MATIDKAAIGWSIGIVAVGVMFAFYGQSVQDAGTPMFGAPVATTPSAPAAETAPMTDPFAERAAQIMAQQAAKEEQTMAEEMQPSEPVAETQPSAPVAEEEQPAPMAEEPMASGPQTVSVSIPAGTSSPGCEETNACFIPAAVTINAGDTVIWTNDDSAAHTVTSGTPADGPDGIFDSSLILGGASYERTFDEAGSYNYFCMVHPWMNGNVQVN